MDRFLVYSPGAYRWPARSSQVSVKDMFVSFMHHGPHSAETESEEEGKILGKRLKELLKLEQTTEGGSLAKPHDEEDLPSVVTDRSN